VPALDLGIRSPGPDIRDLDQGHPPPARRSDQQALDVDETLALARRQTDDDLHLFAPALLTQRLGAVERVAYLTRHLRRSQPQTARLRPQPKIELGLARRIAVVDVA